MGDKMIQKDCRRKLTKGSVTIFLLISFVLLGSGCFPYRELSSFTGKVVDTDTKEPIVGAVVLAVYYGSTSSVGGSNSYPIDAQETITDDKGKFEIPKTRRWFVFRGNGWPSGELIIFKPGYGAFPNHSRSDSVWKKKSSSTQRKYIVYEIPELKSREERAKTVIDVGIRYDLLFSKQKMIIQRL